MVGALFPLAFGGIFVFLLVQAFRLMRFGWPFHEPQTELTNQTDRTGLITTHPEILDAAGEITTEDLLAVRFTGPSDFVASND